jgi:hypothetical protein
VPGRAATAIVPVDDHRLRPGSKHVLAEADRHRHAERARHDRGVGGGSPVGQRDAENQAVLEAKVGDVGRPRSRAIEDRRPGRRGQLGASERADCPDAELADVRGARCEQWIGSIDSASA